MARDLFYAVFHTAAGWAGLLGSEAGLRRATLPQPSKVEVIRLLGIDSSLGEASLKIYQNLIERLQAYYDGCQVDFNDKLDLFVGTDFQRSVWAATRTIPYGETRNYAWIAKRIGKPRAPRAVGQALKINPLPVIIPCHRVIASDGSLRGFGGGVEMKSYLLGLEECSKTR